MGYDARYDPDADFDRWYTIGTARAIVPRLHAGDEVLELGCATGLMTAAFVAAGASVVGVDRSDAYLGRARDRGLVEAKFICSDVATLDLGQTFHHVVAANLAHEVPDPDGLFAVAVRHLRPDGLVHITVPNPRSLHRLVGVEMGLLADTSVISDRAQQLETLRMLDAEAIEELAGAHGLKVVARGGVMLKPLPNDRMAELPTDLLEGLLAAARHAPELCAMSYLVLQ